MPCITNGRAGSRGKLARKEEKKCGKEVVRRREFRRKLAKLCLRWHNAWRGKQRIPKGLIESLKKEANII